jgi:hypothetical protein
MRPVGGALERLIEQQAGVVSRAQLVELGWTGASISRRVTSARWQRLFRGVFVTHSGPVVWRSRAFGALLYAGRDAALSHGSAAFVHGFAREPSLITVTVPATRTVRAQPGLVVHRRVDMPPAWGRPRRLDRGVTVVDLAAALSSSDDVVGLVTASVRAGAHPEEILAALGGRGRVPHRRLLAELVGNVASGIESPLEYRYHRDVERRHRLPAARLQVSHRLEHGWIRADRLYESLGVRVELDGGLAHPGGRTDADVWRDNAVVVARAEITLRYRWRHVVVDPCGTARQVGQALCSRGWRGSAQPCGPGCAVAR